MAIDPVEAARKILRAACFAADFPRPGPHAGETLDAWAAASIADVVKRPNAVGDPGLARAAVQRAVEAAVDGNERLCFAALCELLRLKPLD